MKRTKPKPPTCCCCYGKGLCGDWAKLGYRVPIGDSGIGSNSKNPIPCDRCNRK